MSRFFKGKTLFPPPKSTCKMKQKMQPHQLLGFFSLELGISATQCCISWGGRAVKWPARTKPPEIPKQKTFSSLHNSTYVTPPHFAQTAAALHVGELGVFAGKKTKAKQNQKKTTKKTFLQRLLEAGIGKLGNGLSLRPGSTAQHTDLP